MIGIHTQLRLVVQLQICMHLRRVTYFAQSLRTRKTRGLGCVTRAQVHAQFTQPIPRIFLHFCTCMHLLTQPTKWSQSLNAQFAIVIVICIAIEKETLFFSVNPFLEDHKCQSRPGSGLPGRIQSRQDSNRRRLLRSLPDSTRHPRQSPQERGYLRLPLWIHLGNSPLPLLCRPRPPGRIQIRPQVLQRLLLIRRESNRRRQCPRPRPVGKSQILRWNRRRDRSLLLLLVLLLLWRRYQ